MIVDNLSDNFLLQKNNGIFISTWYEDPNDTELKQLIPLLKQIVILEVSDVRVTLKEFRDQVERMIAEGSLDLLDGQLSSDLIEQTPEKGGRRGDHSIESV